MSARYQVERKKPKARIPLFSSSWVALYFVLRHEFTQSRARAK